jgi:hypothetical protein
MACNVRRPEICTRAGLPPLPNGREEDPDRPVGSVFAVDPDPLNPDPSEPDPPDPDRPVPDRLRDRVGTSSGSSSPRSSP